MSLGVCTLSFLSHKIEHSLIHLSEENILKIRNAKRTNTNKELRAFLELTEFYREYLPNYVAVAVPLTDLTKKGLPNKLEWKEAQEKAYFGVEYATIWPTHTQVA